MKHNTKITAILIGMFLLTQLIGLFIIDTYNSGLKLPYGMEQPPEVTQESSLISILFAFPIAIALFFLLTRLKAERVIKLWFFFVTSIALGITFNVLIFKMNLIVYSAWIALFFAVPLAYLKLFKKNLYVHNLTELLIYPGIAAVFVPLLNVFGIILLLFLISLYDVWAVWHSEFMQKMAKFQIDNLKIFTGFFIPYANKKQKEKIKIIKEKYKNKSDEELQKKFEKEKIRVNLAILGGGDIIFPIITAGVILKSTGSILSALIITLFATISLLMLFIVARKGKFYPAMPFLTIGLYLGIVINWILMGIGVL